MSRKVWIETVLIVAVVIGLYMYIPAGSVGAEFAVVIPAAAADNPKVAGPLQTAALPGDVSGACRLFISTFKACVKCCPDTPVEANRPPSMKRSAPARPAMRNPFRFASIPKK